MSRIGSALLAATITGIALTAINGPAPAAAAPPSIAVDPSALVYTVKNGDYLVGIAVKLSVRVTDLLMVNKLSITSSIHPGDKLAVPVGGRLPVETVTVAPVAATPAPAAAPAPAVAAVPASINTEYVVKNGDFLVGIAARNGVTFKALLTANTMTAATPIFPGMKISLPPATLSIPVAAPAAAPIPAAPVPASANTEYVVKNGDFLVGIAAGVGVTLKALLAANSMTVSSAIYPGSKLVVPPATLPIPAAVAAVPESPAGPTAQQASIATVIAFLQGELGKPYLFNSDGPDAYDCSGLVVAAYRTIGINLPHQSLLLSQKGTNVDWRTSDIQAGDLIFQIGSGKTVISHVGIAVSSTQWIQSARTGDFVKIGPIPIDDKIQAVRRIVN